MKVNITHKKFRRLSNHLFVLPVFEDERPLKKMNGFIDWRLCGRISQLLMENRFAGNLGEKLLLTGVPKAVAQNLVLVGLGKKKNFGQSPLHEVFSAIGEFLPKLNLTAIAVAPENFFSNYIKLPKVMDEIAGLIKQFRVKEDSRPNLSLLLFQQSILEEVRKELVRWKGQFDFVQTNPFEGL
jgi:hypothetical protein